MHLGHHIRDALTRQSTFSSIDFVKNKYKRAKRKIYKPVPPNVRPCRMLGATNFFHLRLRPVRILCSLYGTVEKQKNTQDSAEQNLPK